MKIFKLIFLTTLLVMATVSSQANEGQEKEYQRIVSLLPSVTEILYALNAEDRVIGVTRYCMYPPQAREKASVGGFIDVNYEALYTLKPDLVILRVNSEEQKKKIEDMGLETFEIETRSIEGILTSIGRIGVKLNREENAQKIIDRIENAIDDIQQKVKGLPKPRVLVSYFRSVGTKVISEVYIAGDRTYFNELVEIAGGVNAYEGSNLVVSPIVSAEGILAMNPDMIIEIISMANGTGLTDEEVLKDWEMLSDLDAYKNNKIHIFNTSYSGLPGPRLDMAVADIAEYIHPEVDWNKDE